MSPRIIAHRGASVAAPENTFAAFELAVELGATSLELDVDVTRDGHLVVLHDSRVNRTSNGVGHVRDFRLEELRALRFDRGFEGRFPEGATRIPTLAEVLDFAVERGLWVNVETKDYSDDWAAVNELVGTAIRSRDLAEQTLVSSINHRAMAGLSRTHPELPTAIAFLETFVDVPAYAARCGAQVLHPHFSLVEASFVERAHAAGLGVNAWTVDDEATATRLLATGIDGLMTNRPDIGLRALAATHPEETHP